MSTVHPLPTRRASTEEVVIALHCSGSSARQWDAYPKLLPRGMHLVAPQLMGYFPGERWTAGAPVSLEAEARRLGPLLFGATGPVHLVGHSYGGAVALQMALRWPARIRTLTLFEPVRFALLLGSVEHARMGRAIAEAGQRICSHTASGRLKEAATLFVDYWSGAGAWDALPPVRQRAIVERMPKVQAEFEALFTDPMPAWSYGALEMPMRLISGSQSPQPARTVVELLARQCPQAEVVRLDGVGHMGPISHPGLVARQLAFHPREEQTALAA